MVCVVRTKDEERIVLLSVRVYVRLGVILASGVRVCYLLHDNGSVVNVNLTWANYLD